VRGQLHEPDEHHSGLTEFYLRVACMCSYNMNQTIINSVFPGEGPASIRSAPGVSIVHAVRFD
jgi:hypothetical protein